MNALIGCLAAFCCISKKSTPFFFQILDAIENEKVIKKTIKIYNVDRAVCGRIAGVVAKKYGDTGFAGQLNIT